MKRMALCAKLGLLVALVWWGAAANAEDGSYLYKTTLLRAAPGELLEVIDLLKQKAEVDAKLGEEPAFLMRHSQGDQWDLLLLQPMGSYSAHYAPERTAKRENAQGAAELQKKLLERIAWQEDVLVWGRPLETVKQAFGGAGFFHVEMFHALPGKRAELVRQREMENDYLNQLERPTNLIFVRDQGAAWDVYTIGFYRDLKHYAESADTPAEAQEAAAKAAGFASAGAIGPYLRTLISSHHDTLAVAVR